MKMSRRKIRSSMRPYTICTYFDIIFSTFKVKTVRNFFLNLSCDLQKKKNHFRQSRAQPGKKVFTRCQLGILPQDEMRSYYYLSMVFINIKDDFNMI